MTEIKKHNTEYLSFHEVNVIKNPPIDKELPYFISQPLEATESVESVEKPTQLILERVVDESTWNTLSDFNNVAISSILNHDKPDHAIEIDNDSLNYEEMVVIDGQHESIF